MTPATHASLVTTLLGPGTAELEYTDEERANLAVVHAYRSVPMPQRARSSSCARVM